MGQGAVLIWAGTPQEHEVTVLVEPIRQQRETRHNGECLTIKTSPLLVWSCVSTHHSNKMDSWEEEWISVGYEAKNLLNILYKVVEKMSKALKFQGSYLTALITTGHQAVGSWDHGCIMKKIRGGLS